MGNSEDNDKYKCQVCGRVDPLPFTCTYCKGTYCAEHRLPENHACDGNIVRMPYTIKMNGGTLTVKKDTTHKPEKRS
jgi:predicted nucleic acid binding AN1-type Zn finger protein